MTGLDAPLRILFAAPAYWPAEAFGGPIPVMRSLATGLVARGHAVDVLTTSLLTVSASGARRTRSATIDGARVVYLATPFRYRWMGIPPTLPVWLARLPRPDVVHVFGLRDPVGSLAAAWCRLRGIPYVLEGLGMFEPKLRKVRAKQLLDATLFRPVVRGATLLVAASGRERDEYLRSGIGTGRVVVRPNGFPAVAHDVAEEAGIRERLGLPAQAPLVLGVGRLAEGKGLDLLVEAMPQLPEAHLVLVGPDDGHGTPGRLEALAHARGVVGRVHLVGTQPAAILRQLYAAATVLVLASRHENFGMVAAEAASAGLPVVVSDRCGVAELLGDAALVVPVAAGPLAAAIGRVLDEPELAKRLSRAGRAVAERYAWPVIVEQQERIYRAAVG